MCFQEISHKIPYSIYFKNMYLAESNLAHCVVYCPMTCGLKTFVEFFVYIQAYHKIPQNELNKFHS